MYRYTFVYRHIGMHVLITLTASYSEADREVKYENCGTFALMSDVFDVLRTVIETGVRVIDADRKQDDAQVCIEFINARTHERNNAK